MTRSRRALAAPFIITMALAPAVHAEDSAAKKPKADPSRPYDKRGGKCYQHPEEHCPPGAHCNPGPPREVECPPEAKPGKDAQKK
jgi:hypothetical protein